MTVENEIRDLLRSRADRLPEHYPMPPEVARRSRNRRTTTAVLACVMLFAAAVGATALLRALQTDNPPAIEPIRPPDAGLFPHPRTEGAVALGAGTYPSGDEWVLYAIVGNDRVKMGSLRLGFPWTAWRFTTRLPVPTRMLKSLPYVSFRSDNFVTVEGMTSADAVDARIELDVGAPITVRLIDAPAGLGASVKFIKSTMPLGTKGRLVVEYADGTTKSRRLPAQGGGAPLEYAQDQQRAEFACLWRLDQEVANPRGRDFVACENADPADYEPEDIEY